MAKKGQNVALNMGEIERNFAHIDPPLSPILRLNFAHIDPKNLQPSLKNGQIVDNFSFPSGSIFATKPL